MKDVSEQDLKHNLPLVSVDAKDTFSTVKVKDVEISRNTFTVMAGPCAVENLDKIVEIAGEVKKKGAVILRGGAFKPLTFPYRSDSFFELREEGLEYLNEARKIHGIPVVTELMDIRFLEKICECTDMIQIGSRNMQNFPLLEEVARTGFPVLLKRHFGCSLRDWLGAAEYILYNGNVNVVLCERGITAPHTHRVTSRFIVDLQVIPAAQELTHLPIIVDPSHSTFRREFVSPVARAACAIGADGILVDVHPNPSEAAVDPLNALDFENFGFLMDDLKQISKIIKKKLNKT